VSERRRGQGCPSILSVVCCQVVVSSTGRSVVQRSLTECSVSGCNRKASVTRKPWLSGGLLIHGEKK